MTPLPSSHSERLIPGRANQLKTLLPYAEGHPCHILCFLFDITFLKIYYFMYTGILPAYMSMYLVPIEARRRPGV